MSETAAAFRRAVETRDHPALVATLSPGVVFHSPVKLHTFDGRDAVARVLAGAFQVFADFRYVAEFGSPDGHVLMFEANVDELQIQGVDILRFGPDGLIDDLTVMTRPYKAVTRLKDRMAELLGMVEPTG
jgi:hypothetical protein